MSATEVRTSGAAGTMKAVNYQGAFKVKVEDVPMPKIEHPDDVIVKVTTSGEFVTLSQFHTKTWVKHLSLTFSPIAICGSDLHMALQNDLRS
jgi:threonine dehydrogenase-like Zn-dependent dehydrogenase